MALGQCDVSCVSLSPSLLLTILSQCSLDSFPFLGSSCTTTFTVPHPPPLRHLDLFIVLESFTSFLCWLLRGNFLVVFAAFEIHDAAFVDDRNFYNCTVFLLSFYSSVLIYVTNIGSQTKGFLSYSEHTDITVF